MLTRSKLILLIISLQQMLCDATLKTWHPTEKTVWEYVGSNKQCSEQTIAYQKNILGAIMFPEKFTNITALILPKNGALIIKSNEALSFQSKINRSCDISNYVRRHLIPSSWFLSRNWITSRDHAEENYNAIPHIERIPCECDEIEFPKNESVSVSLWPAGELSINSLKMNGKLSDFETFRQTELGQIIFSDNTDVNVQSSVCNPSSKSCACFDSKRFYEYESYLCYAEEQYCSVPHCLQPIRPIGHCCDICGATLLYNTTNNDNSHPSPSLLCNSNIESYMKRLQKILYQLNDGKYYYLVDVHASIVPQKQNDGTMKNVVQLIIVDKDDNYQGYSVQLVNKLIADRQFKGKKLNFFETFIK